MWILLALLATSVVANDNLRVAYQWKQIDFEFPNIDERQAAITNLTFISENVIPVGLEVYQNRLFITLPRWKKGVPASLAYIDLNGKYFHASLLFLWWVSDDEIATLLQKKSQKCDLTTNIIFQLPSARTEQSKSLETFAFFCGDLISFWWIVVSIKFGASESGGIFGFIEWHNGDVDHNCVYLKFT